MAEKGDWPDTVDDGLASFIAKRDSFYLGTASADGQPYIQHRGGRAGFLHVLDDKTLAFADFAGNRQYLSLGNLAENPKAFIFLMDYAGRRRIKIWGRARVVEDDPGLIARLVGDDGDAAADRAIVFEIEAWDRNCPQFITPRHGDAEIAEIVAPLTARIAELEAEIAALRN
jgi:predicted pyridoxine 5'-phosphate oxidase superfamily flavin-nucleotide-binding protein